MIKKVRLLKRNDLYLFDKADQTKTEEKLVEVLWVDAFGKQKANLGDLNAPIGSSIDESITFGILHAVDRKAVVILQEKGKAVCDYVSIPRGVIKEVRLLRRAGLYHYRSSS